MWAELLTAIALVLVIEGLFPLISPRAFRDSLRVIIDRNDQTLRIVGLSSMIAGALLISFIR
ncbi:MAG: DUF2065 domain-containing protein [Granulosicoccaceae bacterium]